MGIPANCPAIGSVAPYASQYDTLKFEGEKVSVPALGVTTEFLPLNKLKLAKGRFIHPLDRYMFYCVVGRKISDMLRSRGVMDVVGTRILYKERYFTIIGEIEEAPMGGMRPYEINEGIMVPISTLQRIFREAQIRSIMARSRGR